MLIKVDKCVVYSNTMQRYDEGLLNNGYFGQARIFNTQQAAESTRQYTAQQKDTPKYRYEIFSKKVIIFTTSITMVIFDVMFSIFVRLINKDGA